MEDKRLPVSERLDNVLDLAPSNPSGINPEIVPETPVIEVEFSAAGASEKAMDSDFDYARKALFELIESGKDLTSNSLHFAKERQDPDSVKASANAQKETRESVMALIDLHRTRKEIERISAPPAQPANNGDTTINQTVFYGTTAEMMKMLKDMPTLPSIEAAGPIEDTTPTKKVKK